MLIHTAVSLHYSTKFNISFPFPSLKLLSSTVRKFALIIYNELIYATPIYM